MCFYILVISIDRAKIVVWKWRKFVMTKMSWCYAHESELTEKDLEELRVELESKEKSAKLDVSETEVLKALRAGINPAQLGGLIAMGL